MDGVALFVAVMSFPMLFVIVVVFLDRVLPPARP